MTVSRWAFFCQLVLALLAHISWSQPSQLLLAGRGYSATEHNPGAAQTYTNFSRCSPLKIFLLKINLLSHHEPIVTSEPWAVTCQISHPSNQNIHYGQPCIFKSSPSPLLPFTLQLSPFILLHFIISHFCAFSSLKTNLPICTICQTNRNQMKICSCLPLQLHLQGLQQSNSLLPSSSSHQPRVNLPAPVDWHGLPFTDLSQAQPKDRVLQAVLSKAFLSSQSPKRWYALEEIC